MDALGGSFVTDQYVAVVGLMIIGFLFVWLERAITPLLAQRRPPYHSHDYAPFLVPPAESQRFSPFTAKGGRRHLLPRAMAGKPWKPGL